MFDLNTIINAALTAAVVEATKPLLERIEKLEALTDRVVALENNPAQGQDLTPTTGLTRDQVEDLIEAKMDLHLECYDHDEYDSHIGDDDKHFEGDIEDAVRDTVRNMSFEVTLS